MDYYYMGFAAMAAIGLLAFFFLRKNVHPSNPVHNLQKIKSAKRSTNQQPMQGKDKDKQKSQQVKKQQQSSVATIRVKKIQELSKQYEGLFFGSFKLKGDKSIHAITALDFRGSKLLLTNTKNQMVLFNLKNWKKDASHSSPEKYFVSLDNNGASAVCIGQNYYYAALTFDKTIVYYQFKGQSGIYFKEVFKFPRNIFKSNASAMYVSKKQTYIITTGTGNDTVIDVWSMKGQKLANANSFQIEHYGITYGFKDILIRGWTSEAKIFNIVEEKDGSFKKLQKGQHLPHEQSPLYSAIDNRDMYAMSISKNHKIKIWYLYDTAFHRTTQSSKSQHTEFTQNQIDKCALYTFQPAVGHFKTVVILTYEKGLYITDTNLKIIQKIQGIEIKDIYLNGTSKSVILGVVNNSGQICLWNLTKQLEKVAQVSL